ncbi:N-acetyltransferase GCN5 [Halosimplex carlsbadense 2-9-1]|uniref:N-acetyltransferase GCN5 n=1 Tax=Halosimplex carlsbadense 2-9-1 TaxID=797114 RepID=M0CGA7_9EURY|nr:metal-dependent hydrolase [Halosimplex carlsbadense]ELZ22286.1 N-acetyltransferase GCN5 [Halosimplex carlsbadense 2-9-1]
MVDVMGHLAMGLLWSLPAWFVWHDRVSVVFVALAVFMAPIPDVDKYIAMVFPDAVHHHGVTHTVVFVVAAALVLGALAAWLLTDRVDRWVNHEHFDSSSMFVFATAAVLVGGLSHVFADMLSAPDISTPIEPLWPVVDGSWGLDLIWYNNPLWNVVFLAVMLLAHGVLAYSAFKIDHPYRIQNV